jgi:Zn-dependent protease with chaperone function
MMRRLMRFVVVAALAVPGTGTAELVGSVVKPAVDVRERPALDAPTLETLQRGATVTITAQQGLWYQLQRPMAAGYVRVNDVRLAPTGTSDGSANLRVLMGEKAGQGRATETAGVRGIDESELKSASLDRAQLDSMVAQRADAPTAAAHAAAQGWQATQVVYAAEARPAKVSGQQAESTPSRAATVKAVSGLLGSFGSDLGSKLASTEKVVPKSQGELAAEELALGPEITGRLLGARPLWSDADAQRRVNLVGRWVASQTSRPELPWTFGVIDTPEVNAFAAPGGYVVVTRGLYELLLTDAELAAVLGHEIGHCVQRDHYNVIHKQEMATAGKDLAVNSAQPSGGSAAAVFARRYVEEHGATILLTALDREAEYRADESAQYYLARAGLNPLALHSVLQRLGALGPGSAGLAQLYKTHPPFDARIDRLDQRADGPLQPYLQRE